MTSQLPFNIEIDPRQSLIKVRLTGFWTANIMALYKVEIWAALEEMWPKVLKDTQIKILVDRTEASVQSQQIIEQLQNLVNEASRFNCRIATVVSGALQKIQADRITSAKQKIFYDEADALSWLLERRQGS